MIEQKKRVAVPVLAGMSCDNYLAALRETGMEAVVVTDAALDVSAFDGLLSPGGVDIHPERYGQAVNGTEKTNRALDELQLAVLDAFVKAGKPVLGICRGHQLINVYFGGTLIQNLPMRRRHARDEGSDQDKVHMNAAAAGSWIDALYGPSLSTNSSHHQAVDRAGEGLIVDARSDDGVVEAMHHESLPIYSVQWHPERMSYALRRSDTVDGSGIFRVFMNLM